MTRATTGPRPAVDPPLPEAAGPDVLVIGLIGRIGAGKSTVARELATLGAEVIDADRLAHEVLDEPEARDAIVARFGTTVLGSDGRVDRRALAGIVFGPRAAGKKAIGDLEAIVHPRVRRRIHERLAELRTAAGGARRIVVLDVPLLVQSGWAAACDRLLVVECAEAVRQERLARRGWNAEEREARESNWERGFDPGALDPEETRRVDASGDVTYTRDQIEALWSDWLNH
jgi:dephospho-CoA kinase